MKTISVKAVKREEYGKKAAKAVRREGMVPCVLSGHGESVAFSVDPREIKPLIYTPNSYIVEFDFDGKKEQAVLREAQFHPVREQILHLDFYRIADGKPVSIAIPVRLTGNDLKFENLKFVTPATTAVCAVRVTRASRGAAAQD